MTASLIRFLRPATWPRFRIALSVTIAMLTLAPCQSSGATPTTDRWKEQEEVLDHFLCYRIGGNAIRNVKLEDQFLIESKTIKTGDRLYLCNPVEKTKGKRKVERKRLNSHLVCYQIPSDTVDKKLLVTNQLVPDGAKLELKSARYLCLPSGKALNWKRGDPEPEIPTDLDHFKCYSPKTTTGAKQTVTVHLKDQFVDADFDVSLKDPDVCNPVDKTLLNDNGKEENTAKRQHPDAHLVCYLLELTHQQTARIKNQFEGVRVTTEAATRLCVPSVKQELTN